MTQAEAFGNAEIPRFARDDNGIVILSGIGRGRTQDDRYEGARLRHRFGKSETLSS